MFNALRTVFESTPCRKQCEIVTAANRRTDIVYALVLNYFTAKHATDMVAKQRSKREIFLEKMSQQVACAITLSIKENLGDIDFSQETINCVDTFKPRELATLCHVALSLVRTESDVLIGPDYLNSEENFLPLMHKVQSLLQDLGYTVEFVWEKVMPRTRGMKRKVLISIESDSIGTTYDTSQEYSPMREKPKSDYSTNYESLRVISVTRPIGNDGLMHESLGMTKSHFVRPDGGTSKWMLLRPSMNIRWPEPTEQDIEKVLKDSLGKEDVTSLDSWEQRLQHIG